MYLLKKGKNLTSKDTVINLVALLILWYPIILKKIISEQNLRLVKIKR